MVGADLSLDDNTGGITTDIKKNMRSIYFVLVTFSISILVDVFSPVV